MAKNVRDGLPAGDRGDRISPFAVFALCGALLAGLLLGTTVLPWLSGKVQEIGSHSNSVVGSYVDIEDMKDGDGKFVIQPFPADVASSFVELPDLDGLTIEPVEKPEITEEDIDSNVRTYMIYNGKEAKRTDGVCNAGDRVLANYSCSVDGEPLEGYSGEEVVIQMGDEDEPEGFSEALEGVAVGETVTFEAKFPEDWEDEIAGTTAEFTVEILAVMEMPEITDETISDLTGGGYDTVEAFRTYIRESLESIDGHTYRDLVYAECVEALTAGSTFKTMSREMLTWYVSLQLKYYQAAADAHEVEIGEYLKSVGLTDDLDALADMIANDGVSAVRRYAMLTAVADKTGLTIDPEDEDDKALIDARYGELQAGLYLDSSEAVDEYYGVSNVYNDARNQKTINWLIENVRQEHADAGTEVGDDAVEGS